MERPQVPKQFVELDDGKYQVVTCCSQFRFERDRNVITRKFQGLRVIDGHGPGNQRYAYFCKRVVDAEFREIEPAKEEKETNENG